MAANTRHLKRESMPTSWGIKRKNINFISRPNPGAHKLEYSVSLLILIRDVLGYVDNLKEAKHAVKNSEILVNGAKADDVRRTCGLFDVVEIKATSEKFTILFDELGKLKLVPTKEDVLYSKVSKKTVLGTKKFQLSCTNGNSILVDEKTFKSTSVNDTIVYDFSKKKISTHIPLKEKSFVYIFDGKYKGKFGEVKSITKYNGLGRDIAEVDTGDAVNTTAFEYCHAIGTKKDEVKKFN